jgi:hypothetical protein
MVQGRHSTIIAVARIEFNFRKYFKLKVKHYSQVQTQAVNFDAGTDISFFTCGHFFYSFFVA